jgi:hypothetical protein
LGGCGDCLKNHWGIEGKRLYEMWRSHVKHAVTGNDHACLTSSLAVVGEVLNSIPDRPGQPHDLEYLLVGGLLGGLINSADGKGQENVQWRKILTSLRKDHKWDICITRICDSVLVGCAVSKSSWDVLCDCGNDSKALTW